MAAQQQQGEAGPTIPVRFTVHKEVDQGQYLVVVGNNASLGGWKAGQGLHMNWGEGHVWWAEASFAPGTLLEFKVDVGCVCTCQCVVRAWLLVLVVCV